MYHDNTYIYIYTKIIIIKINNYILNWLQIYMYMLLKECVREVV